MSAGASSSASARCSAGRAPARGDGAPALDAIDRRIVNRLQDGIEIVDRPFAAVATALELTEAELLARLARLLETGVLTRFGPMYNADAMGGAVTLAAMAVPPAAFERVARTVNDFPEVAHNYERDHAFNMWFVIASERPERVAEVIDEIEARTKLPVFAMPKEEEFYVGLKLDV